MISSVSAYIEKARENNSSSERIVHIVRESIFLHAKLSLDIQCFLVKQNHIKLIVSQSTKFLLMKHKEMIENDIFLQTHERFTLV